MRAEYRNFYQFKTFTLDVKAIRFLLRRLPLHVYLEEKFTDSSLKSPFYPTAYYQGFGTLYTADYGSRRRQVDICWPGVVWPFELDNFQEGVRRVLTPTVTAQIFCTRMLPA